MRQAWMVAVAAAMCAALAGCGGHTVTRRDVIARADAICASALRQVRAIAPAGSLSSPANLAPYLGQVVPVLEREVASLQTLPRPAAHRQLLDRYLAAIRLLGSDYRSLQTAAKLADQAGVFSALSEIRASQAPALAQSYGMSQCAAPAGTTT